MADQPLASNELHPSAQRVANALRERGVRGPVHQFAVSTKTSADAAAALDCEIGAIASCLVFMLGDEPLVVVKSGANRVDTTVLARVAGGERTRQATPDEVRAATGQPIGGVSPVGWPQELRVFIDDTLATYARVWSACGTPNAVFATTYDELRHLTNATPLSLR
ncbi:MAG: YbaK/EbsC family protein [Acidobacteria bacterium]|nr:YbaK/EbsC family protein [Acidobacteriota bacterium]